MSENETRLIHCFASVFPTLGEENIVTAHADATFGWDSLTGVMLAAVIQEEFEFEFAPEALPALDSFVALRNYLRTANPAGE